MVEMIFESTFPTKTTHIYSVEMIFGSIFPIKTT